MVTVAGGAAAGQAEQDVVAGQARLVLLGVVEGPVVGGAHKSASPAIRVGASVDADGECDAELSIRSPDRAGPALKRALVRGAGVGVPPPVGLSERSAVAGHGVGQVPVVVGALTERIGGQDGGAAGDVERVVGE